MDRLQAKFTCHEVTRSMYGERPSLGAIYGTSEEDPNRAWAKATPSGKLEMQIDNPAAQGFFEPGKHYLITIEEAE